MGGEGFAVASLLPGRSMRVAHNRGLNGWCEHFVAMGYARFCPITERIGKARHPFSWNEVAATSLEEWQREVLDVARDFGVTDGAIVPVRTRGGFKGNVFVRIAEASLDQSARQALIAVSLAFHSQLLTLGQGATDDDEQLSPRERDVLSWLAEGKSSEDIADLLGISAATVLFHYRHLADRFGTLTRAHTVVEAIRRGLLVVA
jgi:LuxR family quorum sensing-dependent transcriptional regulator